MKPTALALRRRVYDESTGRAQSLWALCSLPPIVEPANAAHIQSLDISSARNQGHTPKSRKVNIVSDHRDLTGALLMFRIQLLN